MFISDINIKNNRKQIRKTILIYLVLSLAAIAVNNIYGIFGHGVHSASMTWMFLYPLLTGAMFYLLIDQLAPGATGLAGYRLFYNCYNSGVAALTLGSFLKGILDIAGTNSTYVVLFHIIGWLLIAAALIFLLILVTHKNRKI